MTYHDQFCRCNICRPALPCDAPPEGTILWWRVIVTTIALAAIVLFVAPWWLR